MFFPDTGQVRTTQTIARWLLAVILAVAGVGHLTHQRTEFRAQVPEWFPVDADLVVLASGAVEIGLGLALVVASQRRATVGWIVAAFFVAIFPGNVAQWREGTDAFGLDSDAARFTRLFLQPVLIAWVLWCTNAWRTWRSGRRRQLPGPAVQ